MTNIARHAKNAFGVSLVSMLLAACSTPVPPYLPPTDGTPLALIKSDIWGATNRNESIEVYVLEGECGSSKSKKLFSIKDAKSKPDGYIKIAANKLHRFQYYEEVSGGRQCTVTIAAQLEEGKKYSFTGGFASKSGLIPFLVTRMCKLGIHDDIENVDVPAMRSCP